MCDGLGHNIPKAFETILCNCLAHGRRKFVKTLAAFPDESQVVILALRDVYYFDALAKECELTKEERLRFHREESAPIMAALERWLQGQLDEKLLEENSSFGKAIQYLLKRWHKLTRFLRTPGAPLDNNLCERVLKKSILHRKNSLFYRNEVGAKVGDTFQSLIHTAELTKVNPLDNLSALLKNAAEVKRDPRSWLPWNFRGALERLESATAH